MDDAHATEILEFWEVARVRAGVARTAVVTGYSPAASVPPPAWSFADTPDLADQLLELVLDGTKTATSTTLAEMEAVGEPVPVVGELSIVLDGGGRPRALLRTTRVDLVPFDEVDAEHAYAEGEDDRSLASWRAEHDRYFRRVLEPLGETFDPQQPVVLERFTLLYPRPSDR
ncbi:ASCH domain-containing protein [Cellulomonas hominis]